MNKASKLLNIPSNLKDITWKDVRNLQEAIRKSETDKSEILVKFTNDGIYTLDTNTCKRILKQFKTDY